MPTRNSEPVQIYQLKVVLRGSHPPIWRQFQVRSDITLGKLHHVLQAVMGWTNTHLHRFLIRGEPYGVSDPGEIAFSRTIDERTYKLEKVEPGVNFRFTYTYDFGDAWEHELLVENILPPEEGVYYPCCLDGERACPPEDVGGMAGYEDFLAAIKNPRHPEQQEYLDWIGHRFDPEAFDVNEVNRKLHPFIQR